MNTIIKRTLGALGLTLLASTWASTANAVPMGFNVDVDLTAPITVPLGGGVQVDAVTGMIFGDPAPQAGSDVLDCFFATPTCEISQMMFEAFNGGTSLATVDLFSGDPGNPFGNFEGTASGAFGTVDVVASLNLVYDIETGQCSGFADFICGTGFFLLSLDQTDDGATADDPGLFRVEFSGGSPSVSGASSPITTIISDMQPLCGAAAPCGTINIDPKRAPVPAPATLLLVGLGLAGLGFRRRLNS